MRRFLAFGLVGFVAFIAACSGSSDGGAGSPGPRDGGATGTGGGSIGAAGGAGNGAAPGGTGNGGAGGATGQCRTTADCPQTNCFMCPTAACVNGQCITSSVGGGAGGVTGTGGAAGSAGAGGTGTISCGAQTCAPSQACITPCCGGSPGFHCTPAPPYCVDIPQSCQGQSLTQCLPLNSCPSSVAVGRIIRCMCP